MKLISAHAKFDYGNYFYDEKNVVRLLKNMLKLCVGNLTLLYNRYLKAVNIENVFVKIRKTRLRTNHTCFTRLKSVNFSKLDIHEVIWHELATGM